MTRLAFLYIESKDMSGNPLIFLTAWTISLTDWYILYSMIGVVVHIPLESTLASQPAMDKYCWLWPVKLGHSIGIEITMLRYRISVGYL